MPECPNCGTENTLGRSRCRECDLTLPFGPPRRGAPDRAAPSSLPTAVDPPSPWSGDHAPLAAVPLADDIRPPSDVGAARDRSRGLPGTTQIAGTVIGDPQVIERPSRPWSSLVGLAVAVVVVAWLVGNGPQIIQLIVLLLVVVVIATLIVGDWLIRPFQLLVELVTGLIAGLLRLLFSLGGGHTAGYCPIAVFRLQEGPRQTEVVLAGHEIGVQLGHDVTVTGIRVRGRLNAIRVVNHTTGVTLWRSGLVGWASAGLAILAVAALLLIGVLK